MTLCVRVFVFVCVNALIMGSVEDEEDLGGIRSCWGKNKYKIFKEGRSLVCLRNIKMAGVARAEMLKSRVLGDEVGEISGTKSWSAL